MHDETTITADHVCEHAAGDSHFDEFLRAVTDHAERATTLASGERPPLFTTDVDLWPIYLDGFHSAEDRQHHNCHACRQFIQRFGGLATITEQGTVQSVFWAAHGSAVQPYLRSEVEMARAVRRARITGVFLSSERQWGTQMTHDLKRGRDWHHFALTPPAQYVYNRVIPSASQAAAFKAQEFQIVSRALSDWTDRTLDTAVRVLESDALYRGEQLLGQAQWLRNLRRSAYANRGQIRQNLVWRAVATAPTGFCHPRSSMLATLLDDIEQGLSFEQVSRRFAEKMHPLRYQRPQEAPTAGAIEAAEALVERLGIAKSLERRFARFEDIGEFLWNPQPGWGERSDGKVFAGVKAKGIQPKDMSTPPRTVTWEKFARECLHGATRVYLQVPSEGPFTSLLTAAHPDAPPIIQWDLAERRNPVSWYFWHPVGPARQFGLAPGSYANVLGICENPSQWYDARSSYRGVMFVLEGAAESKAPSAGLFPEILKSELHGARSVIEAYSKQNSPTGLGEQGAAGLMFMGEQWGARLRVHYADWVSDFIIDRRD